MSSRRSAGGQELRSTSDLLRMAIRPRIGEMGLVVEIPHVNSVRAEKRNWNRSDVSVDMGLDMFPAGGAL
jgi:hypothetical protein